MSLIEIGRWAVAAVLTGLLIFASVSDVRSRRIPNWTVLAIGALFLVTMIDLMLDLLLAFVPFLRWLARIVTSAVLAAAIVIALGYFVLNTNNPVKDEIKLQAVQAAKAEFTNWLFGRSPQANP